MLKPGGYHLMFMDLTGPVKAGDTLDGTLTFARAGRCRCASRSAPSAPRRRRPGAGTSTIEVRGLVGPVTFR